MALNDRDYYHKKIDQLNQPPAAIPRAGIWHRFQGKFLAYLNRRKFEKGSQYLRKNTSNLE